MGTEKAIENIYGEREKFIIIGLTGRTGSGCTTVSNILKTENFDELSLHEPKTTDCESNEERKYHIIYNYAKKHWNPFFRISMTDIIFSFVLQYSFEEFFEYMSRVDAEGITHTEEGVKYYVLHSYQKEYDNIMTIPEPSDDDGMLLNDDTDTEFSPDIVNDFGRFRYVFDDEETAKAVISSELLARIYPYLFILSKEELEEWKYFVDAFEK